MSQAVIGVIVAHPTAGMPRQVSLRWDPFPEEVETIPATVIDPESVPGSGSVFGCPKSSSWVVVIHPLSAPFTFVDADFTIVLFG